MAAPFNRVMISIPPDIQKEIDSLKQEKFYNKPYSELYREVLKLGLNCVKNQKKNGNE